MAALYVVRKYQNGPGHGIIAPTEVIWTCPELTDDQMESLRTR
jgi:hypothetical protein